MRLSRRLIDTGTQTNEPQVDSRWTRGYVAAPTRRHG